MSLVVFPLGMVTAASLLDCDGILELALGRFLEPIPCNSIPLAILEHDNDSTLHFDSDILGIDSVLPGFVFGGGHLKCLEVHSVSVTTTPE